MTGRKTDLGTETYPAESRVCARVLRLRSNTTGDDGLGLSVGEVGAVENCCELVESYELESESRSSEDDDREAHEIEAWAASLYGFVILTREGEDDIWFRIRRLRLVRWRKLRCILSSGGGEEGVGDMGDMGEDEEDMSSEGTTSTLEWTIASIDVDGSMARLEERKR